MKSSFRNAFFSAVSISRSLNPKPSLHQFPLPLIPLNRARLLRSSYGRITTVLRLDLIHCCSSDSISAPTMTTDGGEATSLTAEKLEKQFDDFRQHLEDSGNLRERIRAVAMEIESVTRLMHSSLLLVHQSGPAPEVLEKAKGQIVVLGELFGKLAEIFHECPEHYYRYHGDWRSEAQGVVSLLAFIHWLETGTLLLHTEAEEKLGLNSSDFGLDIEDYLIGKWPEVFISFPPEIYPTNCPCDVPSMLDQGKLRKTGPCSHNVWLCSFLLPEHPPPRAFRWGALQKRLGICFTSNELPRYVVNQVTAGDFDCPRKVLKFLTDLHASFRMLNLRNDFLRKKFDGMKYDLRRVEEVYYDVKIRGLATNETKEQS